MAGRALGYQAAPATRLEHRISNISAVPFHGVDAASARYALHDLNRIRWMGVSTESRVSGLRRINMVPMRPASTRPMSSLIANEAAADMPNKDQASGITIRKRGT